MVPSQQLISRRTAGAALWAARSSPAVRRASIVPDVPNRGRVGALTHVEIQRAVRVDREHLALDPLVVGGGVVLDFVADAEGGLPLKPRLRSARGGPHSPPPLRARAPRPAVRRAPIVVTLVFSPGHVRGLSLIHI